MHLYPTPPPAAFKINQIHEPCITAAAAGACCGRHTAAERGSGGKRRKCVLLPKVFVAVRFLALFVSPGAVVAARRRQGKTVTVRAASLACRSFFILVSSVLVSDFSRQDFGFQCFKRRTSFL
jgi:hypothetical protein